MRVLVHVSEQAALRDACARVYVRMHMWEVRGSHLHACLN